MDDELFNLFLTNEQGWSLFGTLRIRWPQPATTDATDPDRPARSARPALPTLAPSPPALQPATQELTPVPIAGTIALPLFSLFRQVPLTGIAYATAAGLFTIVLNSGNARPGVGLQLTPYASEDLGGFVTWDASSLGDIVFSALARPLPRTF